MNVFSTENRLNEKWVVLAGKLLPGLALILLFLILPTVASAQFTCPTSDNEGFPLGQSNTMTNPIFCSYPAEPMGDPNVFFCTYNQTTGALVTDHDEGLCIANADGTPPPSSASLSVTKIHVGTFTQASTGEWDLSVSNGVGATATSGTTTVSDTLPSGYTVNSFTGTDVSWTCMGTGTQTATCTSTATISGGSNFTPVKITVNIPANSPASVMNTAKAFGGGDTTHTSIGTAASGTDTVSVVQVPTSASLSVTKSHVGTFTQGSTGEWDITVSNGAGAATTFGTTTLSDTLPSGYTVNSFAGAIVPWTCIGIGTQTATCVSTVTISGGSSFMPVKIIVNIPAASPTSVMNTAKAFGGGDTTHTNLASAASGSDTVSVVQVPATITATAGTPQSTNTNTAFPANLQATVTDANSVGVPNVNVTFQAPNSGQSGTFGAPCSGTTCVVMTNAQGVANAPTFTANSTGGSYTVAATTSGVATPANFQLTNIAPAVPPTFTKTITTPFGVINQGDVGQVTFTITNPNATSLTGLAFSDVLPSGLQVQSSPVSNTCGGTATADPVANTISLTGGTVAGSSACTITANVIGQASGSQTNPAVTLASSAGPATATAVTVFVYPWWLVFFY